MKFLVFGDVSGSLGRVGITQVLPELREEFSPDAVIINIENIAHGKGITPQTMQEALTWKAAVYTTGDHAWDHSTFFPILDDVSVPVIRPANYGSKVAGRGWHTFQIGAYQITVINLQGQLFFRSIPDNPFHVIDEILQEPDVKNSHIKLIDFHAETTSESRGFGWHIDGRVSAMWGTHTHVPTADAQILPQGTGYITDVGMNGAYHSIIGMDPTGPLRMFRTAIKAKMEPPESGPIEINGLYLDIDPTTGKTTDIQFIRRILEK